MEGGFSTFGPAFEGHARDAAGRFGCRVRTRSAGARPFPAPGRALLAGVVILAAGTCSKGRETRLLEVLNRSRAAPERIVELESPYLEDSDLDVRALAVWAIGDSGAPGAAAAIAPLADDKEDAVRLAVAKALCEVAFPAGDHGTRSAAPVAGGSATPKDTAAASPAAPSPPVDAAGGSTAPSQEAASTSPPEPAPGAASTLAAPTGSGARGSGPDARPRPPASVEILTRLAGDTDVLTRRVAVRCLVSDPGVDAGVLNHALEDTDEEVRRTVLDRLVAQPRPGTLPGLVAALRFPAIDDRIEAAKAMRALKDPAALPALESIASEHLPSGVRDVVEPTILELRAAKADAERQRAAAADLEREGPAHKADGSNGANDD